MNPQTERTPAPKTITAGPPQAFDPLTAFAAWFLKSPITQIKPPKNGVRNFGTVLSLVLYRQPPFQVELFLNPAGDTGFPHEHRHPDVDTYEVHLAGELPLTVNGIRVAPDDQVRGVAEDGSSLLWGQLVRIGPNDRHGADMREVPSVGAAFLSIQHWLNGVEPTSVGLNWEGPATHPEQAERWAERGITPMDVTSEPPSRERGSE